VAEHKPCKWVPDPEHLPGPGATYELPATSVVEVGMLEIAGTGPMVSTAAAIAAEASRSYRGLAQRLRAHAPGLESRVLCPSCSPSGANPSSRRTAFDQVVHLNDTHGWDREDIADWLETLGIDLTVHAEPVAAQRDLSASVASEMLETVVAMPDVLGAELVTSAKPGPEAVGLNLRLVCGEQMWVAGVDLNAAAAAALARLKYHQVIAHPPPAYPQGLAARITALRWVTGVGSTLVDGQPMVRLHMVCTAQIVIDGPLQWQASRAAVSGHLRNCATCATL
jgi:hypothetical protein